VHDDPLYEYVDGIEVRPLWFFDLEYFKFNVSFVYDRDLAVMISLT